MTTTQLLLMWFIGFVWTFLNFVNFKPNSWEAISVLIFVFWIVSIPFLLGFWFFTLKDVGPMVPINFICYAFIFLGYPANLLFSGWVVRKNKDKSVYLTRKLFKYIGE